MIGKGLYRNLKILVSSAVVWLGIGMAPSALAAASLAISPATGTGIPPAGLDVTLTLTGATGGTVYYTTDGSTPTEGTGTSQLYSSAVHVAEQTGLVSSTTVVFKAKAFVASAEVASTSATYTNFAEPEFSIKFQLDGVADSNDVLELGFVTGATDGLDDDYDVSTVVAPVRTGTGVPPLPVASARFITADHDFLVTDYRSRSTPKCWPLYVQVGGGGISGSTTLTLKWGSATDENYPLPDVASLLLYVDGDANSPYDLRQSGSVTFDQSYEVDTTNLNNSPCRIIYSNLGSGLTATLGPVEAIANGAAWWYRAAGSTTEPGESDWLASGVTVSGLHDGDYEVLFKSIYVDPDVPYYRPADQTVTLVADQTASVTGTYTTKAATATMTVPTLYEYDEGTTTGTVDVECSVACSPDVALTTFEWVFTVSAGWTTDLAHVTVLTDGWECTSVVESPAGTFTLTFTYSGSRAAGGSFSFDTQWTYDGADPSQVTFVVNNASGNSGDADADPPASQNSNPRTATLDVDGKDGFAADDVIYISRYRTYKVANGLDRATVISVLVPSTMSPTNTASEIYDAIETLEGSLDVDGKDGFAADDVIYISRYRTYRVANGLDRDTVISVLVPSTMSPTNTASEIYDSIEAITPSAR